MNLSFKNRIALYYMLATASVITIVFLIVYFVVHTVVYQQLDGDLSFEAHKHTKEIKIVRDSIVFINKEEWEEREHREVQVNPVFIQVVDYKGRLMDKSPNLKEGFLQYDQKMSTNKHFDTRLLDKDIRQVQIPLEREGQLAGYIITAMSQEGPLIVLHNLKKTLLILFPLVLLGLFFVTRFLAGKSIVPVQTITSTADNITRKNLNERISLPKNKDELYSLTTSINELLERVQKALDREKQFTSDASHQLRTPLAVIKGTLEVLVRKERSREEYEAKIASSIKEIDRISEIVDQLLILARFDRSSAQVTHQHVDLHVIIAEVLRRYQDSLDRNELKVTMDVQPPTGITSDPYYVELIIDNLISNAIKYSTTAGIIEITLLPEGRKTKITIQDHGIGIQEKDMQSVFEPFFRSEELLHKHIKGNGLGLSIAAKAAEMIGATLQLESGKEQGTRCTLLFPSFI